MQHSLRKQFKHDIASFPPPPANNPLHFPQNFCTKPEDPGLSRSIRVIVRNQGQAPASHSVTKVEFSPDFRMQPIVASI